MTEMANCAGLEKNWSGDVIIVGAGMVGLVQALALSAHGLRVAICDQSPLKKPEGTRAFARVSAINAASWRFLTALDLEPSIAKASAPIRAIRVNDGLNPGTLDFATRESETLLGQIVPNPVLLAALLDRAHLDANVMIAPSAHIDTMERSAHRAHLGFSDGMQWSAPLLIAADGRDSRMRERAGIGLTSWRYDSSAVNAVIAHDTPHDGVATQIFYSGGPLALLPLPDNADGKPRSAVVWSMPKRDGELMASIGDRAFCAELSRATGGFLGTISAETPRVVHPLGFHQAARLTDSRLALIGDAGHGMHPLAGQGLNMGLRDVAALTECLVDGARTGLDLGDEQILERYNRWRGLDNWMMAATTDALSRLFGLPGAMPAMLRQRGMQAINSMDLIKRQMMAEARGDSGELPKLLLGELV